MLTRMKRFVDGSSPLLALEFHEHGFVAAEASIGSKRMRLRRCLAGAWSEGRWADDPERHGRWLRERFDEAGIQAKRAVVSLPRDAVVFKNLTLPAGSDWELPGLVLLQAEGRSAVPLDRLCVDFITLPRLTDRPGIEVLLATVRRDVVTQYRQLAAAADLELVCLGVSPLAATELLVRAAGDALDAPSLLVCPAPGRIEFTLIYQQRAVYSQGVHLEENSADEIARKVVNGAKRVLSASPLPASSGGVNQIWLLGNPRQQEAARSALQAELEAPVRTVDPFDVVDGERHQELSAESASFAAPLGMLLSAACAAHPSINFLAPRRPVVTHWWKPRWVAAVVLLLAALGAATWFHLDHRKRELDRRLEYLATAESQLRERNDEAKANIESARIIEQWTDGNVAWLDVMLDFVEQMPRTDRAFLTNLRLDIQDDQEHGQVRASGYAREPGDVMALNSRFLELRDRYQLQPHEIRPNLSDKYYQSRFDLEVSVIAPPADDAGPGNGPPTASAALPRRDTPVSNGRGNHGET